MDEHTYPYWLLFKKYIPDLGEPDKDGWAVGSCPFCGESNCFRVNLRSGRWVCLPEPTRTASSLGRKDDLRGFGHVSRPLKRVLPHVVEKAT